MEVTRCQGLDGTRELRATRRRPGPAHWLYRRGAAAAAAVVFKQGTEVPGRSPLPLPSAHVRATPCALLSSARGQHGGGKNVIERVLDGVGYDGRLGVASVGGGAQCSQTVPSNKRDRNA